MSDRYAGQASASNYPSASPPTSPPKANTLTNAISDFDPCLDRLLKYSSELQEVCNLIVDPRPADPGKLQGGDHPSPLISRIHERRSRLVAILDDIEQSMQVLTGAV